MKILCNKICQVLIRTKLLRRLSLVLIGLLVSSLLSVSYAESNKEVFYNTEYYREFDAERYDKYLNYTTFKNTFNQIYGEKTGIPISVILHDWFDKTNDHGDRMLKVGNRVKVSDDVEILPVSKVQSSYQEIPGVLKQNTRVYNASFLPISTDFVTTVNELQKKGIFVINGAGNNYERDIPYIEFRRNNIHTDNFIVVGKISGITKFSITFGNYDITDFSVVAGLYYDGTDNSSIGGSSSAAITTSTIIAQYYTIRPCWNYKDMKKFIYATLRPTSELGITEDNTKTKSYLKYDTRIFDDSFVQSLGLNICTGVGSIDNITQVSDNTDNSTQSTNPQDSNSSIADNSTSISNSNQEIIDEYFQAASDCSVNQKWHCVIQSANNIINLDNSNAEAYALRGLAYSKIGVCDLAVTNINKAVELDSDNSSVVDTYNYVIGLCSNK